MVGTTLAISGQAVETVLETRLQAPGDSGVAIQPAHSLDARPAAGTSHPAQPHAQPNRIAQHRQVENRAPAVFVHALATLAAARAARSLAHMRQQGDARHAGRTFKFGNGETFPEREVEFMIGHESGGRWNRLIGRTTSLFLRAPLSFWSLPSR